MKLERIRFKNINSLKGEHELAFDESPLAEAGLFAITGPTGSGKSTILDVITLALYNTVPRLGAISRNKINSMGSVLTHYMDEAWAEVEYSVEDQRYMSRWSIARNSKNDNLADYNMDIVHLPHGTSLGLKKSEIPKANAEIIGLNYDQFMKSILLSQGEFSKFLQSKKEERAQLLEEITGTHIYRQLGKLAYARAKEKNELIKTLRERQGMILLLPKEERTNLQKRLQEVIEIGKSLTALQLKQDRLINLKKLKNNLELQQEKILEYEKQLSILTNETKEEIIALNQHEEALKYNDYFQTVTQNDRDLLAINQEKKRLKELIGKSQADKDIALNEMSSLIGITIQENSFYESMANFEKTINELDAQLRQSKEKGRDLRERIKDLLHNESYPFNQQISGQIKPSLAIEKISARLLDLPMKTSQSLEELQNEWTVLQDKKANFSALIERYGKLLHLREKQKISKDDILLLKNSLQKNLADQETLNNQNLQKKEALFALKNSYQLAKKSADVQSFRSLLVKDEPCPLCGSLHHPSAHNTELAEIGRLSLLIDETEKQINTHNEQINTLKGYEIKTSSALMQKNELVVQQHEELMSNEKSIVELQEKLQIKSNLQEEELIIKQKELQHRITENQDKSSKILEVKFLQSILQEFEGLDDIINNYRKVNTERQKLYKGTDVGTDADKIQNLYTKSINTITNAKNQLEEKEKQEATTADSLTIALQHLEPLQRKYTLDDARDVFSLLLPNHAREKYAVNRQQLNSLSSEIHALSKSHQENQANFNSSKADLSMEDVETFENESLDHIMQAQQESSSNIRSNSAERGRLENQLEQDEKETQRSERLENDINKLVAENKIWLLMNELIGDANGKKFSSFAQELTLMHLLTRANARLSELTDRYLISFRPDEEDLLVIDRWQGDTERAVKTLSGGETFLISLALALSLSDFASQKVQLKSLFIDEGFGTLDQETLETAMSTLEKLQHNSGKQIGIISHVESLKERINTQIRLQKNVQGYSTLEIVET